MTLSMRIGEGASVATTSSSSAQAAPKRESKAPKKGDGEKTGGTIGELIKQKLGNLKLGEEKDEKDEKDEK